ncbi:hypothetical protein [Actinacidiphila epipremni]|uniref:Uncharacterized protein n=1 Tax=Actinacidiphila epipremni TaxID=2053013 RepID=A0ABX0ZEN6_9ACTN|nr:hypothetical protein [Actinacidiphila epipremni]NJP42258.1 hypothetical protein [Actinacidiphila epipremni]
MPVQDHQQAAVDGHQAAGELRRLLTDLGADPELVQRVSGWADLGEHGYVYVPPLPVEVVEHLTRLLPEGAVW